MCLQILQPSGTLGRHEFLPCLKYRSIARILKVLTLQGLQLALYEGRVDLRQGVRPV